LDAGGPHNDVDTGVPETRVIKNERRAGGRVPAESIPAKPEGKSKEHHRAIKKAERRVGGAIRQARVRRKQAGRAVRQHKPKGWITGPIMMKEMLWAVMKAIHEELGLTLQIILAARTPWNDRIRREMG
jgi:hypothetical protein